MAELRIEPLDPAQATDVLIGNLAALVNDVYAVAEGGIWRADMARTNRQELVV